MNEFSSGLVLMVIGMVVVSCFLLVMMFCSTIMSKMVEKYLPEAKPTATPPTIKRATQNNGGEIAAITTAVHQYIKGRK